MKKSLLTPRFLAGLLLLGIFFSVGSAFSATEETKKEKSVSDSEKIKKSAQIMPLPDLLKGRTATAVSYCGDGVVDRASGEECDDGNLLDGDGCSSTCLLGASCQITCSSSEGKISCSDKLAQKWSFAAAGPNSGGVNGGGQGSNGSAVFNCNSNDIALIRVTAQ